MVRDDNDGKVASPLPLSSVAETSITGELVDVGVIYDGRLVVASSVSEPSQTFAGRDRASDSSPSFPHSASRETYRVNLEIIDTAGNSSTRVLKGVSVAYPKVQLLPDDSTLLVGSRSRFQDGKGEHNALLFSPQGQLLNSFCVGDGVESVQVDRTGRIWVAYFDEGIFGNYGWGSVGADSHKPLGAAGLVCWSSRGEVLYEYSPPSGFDSIADCYALNVFDEEAWACYYTDFPIARIEADFNTTAWNCGIDGANALVVGDHGRFGLVGGYGNQFDRLVVGDLDDADNADPAGYRLVMPNGDNLPQKSRLLARGSYVDVFVDRQWLRLGINDVGIKQG